MIGRYGFVIMTRGRWWKEFLIRRDMPMQSYVQKGLAPPKQTSKILFYVTKPIGEIAGYADFVERRTGSSEELWNDYGKESVVNSKEKYDEFMGKHLKASFVRFRNIREASKPISLSDALLFLGVNRLSRKGFYVNKEIADRLISMMEGKA